MTVSTVKKSHATIPAAWLRRNVVQIRDARLGCGVDACRLEDRPDGGRGDGDAEPGQFSVDAAIAPRRVLASEADDRARVSRRRWTAGRAGAGRSSGSRRGADANAGSCRASPGRSTSGHGRAPERARRGSLGPQVRNADGRSGVAARRVDGATRGSRHPWNDPAATQHQQVDHEPDKTVETGHPPILDRRRPGRSTDTHETPGQPTRTDIRHPHHRDGTERCRATTRLVARC